MKPIILSIQLSLLMSVDIVSCRVFWCFSWSDRLAKVAKGVLVAHLLGYKSTSVESFILLPGSRCSRLSTWHPLTFYELHKKKRTELIWVNQYSHKKVSTVLVDQNMSFFLSDCYIIKCHKSHYKNLLRLKWCPEQTSWITPSAPLDLLLSIYLFPHSCNEGGISSS